MRKTVTREKHEHRRPKAKIKIALKSKWVEMTKVPRVAVINQHSELMGELGGSFTDGYLSFGHRAYYFRKRFIL